MTPATAPHAAPAPAPTSASNALFLIALGMFLTAAVLPALLAALVRTAVLLALLLLACVATNPSDHSFACWVSEQEDIDLRLKKEKPGVKQWFSAVVKTAIAMVTQEPLTWTYHNAVAFSVVFVPSLNRYAFGCLGYWWWADKHPRLLPLCKAPWLGRFTRGGAPSGIEQYMDEDSAEQRRRMSNRVPPPRRATAAGARPPSGGVDDLANAATAFAASMGDLADSFQSSLAASSSSGSRANDSATATGSSDRALRANAVKAKINKDWKEAARLFMEASRAALSVMSRTNYVLEAAWCEVEQATTFPTSSSRLAKTVDDVCEELASAGFFDDAARALSEFALRLKRKFPQDAQREAVVHQLASLYVRAKDIAEAGNNTRSALENAVRAASLFAEAGLWSAAEESFETVAKLHVRSTHPALANESYGNATLCRIAMVDVAGAEQLSMVYRQRLRSQDVNEQSHIDILIASVFDAYEKGSVTLLEQAMKRFESNQRLQPWQLKSLTNIHNKLTSSDLR